MGRAAGRPSRQTHLQRAALGEEAGGGRRAGAGHAVRRPDRGVPQGELRPHRPRAVPGAVHPARARRGRLADPPPVLRRQPGAARGGVGAGGPGAPARHPGRRRDALRLLRPAHPRRRRVRAALRLVVEEGTPAAAGAADLRPGDARQRRPGQRRRGRLSRRVAFRVDRDALDVRVRARLVERRRHRRRAAGGARAGRAGRLRLARAGAARRPRDRADPVAAQGGAHQLRAGARLRPRRPRPDRAARRRRRVPCARPSPASCAR